MAHFAKLDENNIVTAVNVVHSNELLVDGVENEQKGIDFLNTFFNTSDNWKQTSYNTVGGVHKLGGTPFRKNYAGIGDIYDATRDAFMKPTPQFPSWPFNETTCLWEPPIPRPTKTAEQDGDTKHYVWNEKDKSWDYEEVHDFSIY
jgi:hypothetical protein